MNLIRRLWAWWQTVFARRGDTHVEEGQPGGSVVDDQASPGVVVESAVPRPEAAPRRRVEPLRREIAEIVDNFLTAIVERRYETGQSAKTQRDAPWTQGLPHLLNCDFHFVHEFDHGTALERSEDGYLIEYPNEMVRTFWPIDFAVATWKPDGDPRGNQAPAFFLARVASVSAKEVRGRVKIVPQHIVHVSTAYLYLDQPVYAESTLVGLVNNKWQVIENETSRSRMAGNIGADTISTMRSYSKQYRNEIDTVICVQFAARLTHRYEWHVAFGEPDGTRLVVPTSPRACLALFRDRELREGENRRAALRHWVSEHWREKAADPNEIAYVCQHLRGNRHFVWKGFPCELLVSEYDLERNEFFRSQAAEWRAMRKHNRVRVRLKEWKSG